VRESEHDSQNNQDFHIRLKNGVGWFVFIKEERWWHQAAVVVRLLFLAVL
jgi:hypothetical protein